MSGSLEKWLKLPSTSDRMRRQGFREDLVQAVERAAFGRPVEQELAPLQGLLDGTERVVQVVETRHDRSQGLLALTSHRLLFVTRPSKRSTVTRIDLATVTGARTTSRRGFGVLEVDLGPEHLVFDQILGTQGEALAEALNGGDQVAAGPDADRDALVELAQLRALYRAGVIGEAEYQLRKRRLVDEV